MEAETAFEVLVAQAVVQYYRNQGRSDSDIENVRQAGLKNLIGSHLLRCCGDVFEGTPQHTAWRANLYDLRNSVVHEGASVDANQSSQALEDDQSVEIVSGHRENRYINLLNSGG